MKQYLFRKYAIHVHPSLNVFIGNDEAELLRELNKEYNVEIFFQMLPDSNKVSLAEALKQF